MKIVQNQTVAPGVKLLILWYLVIFISTEVLSFFHILSRVNILTAQCIFLVIAFALFKRNIVNSIKCINLRSAATIIVALILLLTFIQGLMSAPSTTDSMVYHLTKVMYWIQEKTVYQDVIRTSHDFAGPFGEFITLHLYNILGNDRLVFLSQWMAFAISIYASGLIALQLGANKIIKDLVRLFTATLPIAVMEATSTQVDMVWTMYIVVSLYIVLVILRKFDIKNVVLLGLVLGFGALTKAYFVIYAIIPLGILSLYLIKTPKKLLLALMLIAIIGSLIMLRFSLQNFKLYGTPLGKHADAGGELVYTNQIFTPAAIFSSTIRHAATQVPVPFVNLQAMSLMVSLHQLMGVDINDSRITCCERFFSIAPILYPQEDIVANPLHLLLIIFAGIVLVKERRKIKDNRIIITFILSIVSFILFCTIFKWAPGNNRLVIPFFMIGSIASILIVSHLKWGSAILRYLMIPISSLALIIILLNVSRPYISYNFFYDKVKVFSQPYAVVPEAFYIRSRMEQYFNAEYFWYDPYDKVTDLLATKPGRKQITFELTANYNFEYPFWVMFQNKNINFNVVPRVLANKNTKIISTSKTPYIRFGYVTQCFKTSIDFGYACLSEIK